VVIERREARVADTYDIAVDFMDMTDDRRLWARPADVRRDVDLAVGRHVVVGDENADPKVARIVSIDSCGNLELEVLPGTVESHLDLLAQA
jgi:hypothetical protein